MPLMQQVRIHADSIKRIKREPDWGESVKIAHFVNQLIREALNLRDNQRKQRKAFGA